MSEPLVSVDLPAAYGGRREFSSFESVAELIKHEREQWAWVQALTRRGSNRAEWSSVWARIEAHWKRIEQKLAQASESEDEGVLDRLASELSADLARCGPTSSAMESLLAGGRIGGWVLDPNRTEAEQLAALCWLLLGRLPTESVAIDLPRQPPGRTTVQLERLTSTALMTVLRLYLIEHGGAEALAASEAALATVVASANTTLEEQKEHGETAVLRLTATTKEWEAALEAAHARLTSFLTAKERAVDESLKLLTEQLLQLQAKLKETEELYSTKLALSAPVAYWTEEGQRNARDATWWTCVTGFALFVVGVSFLVALVVLWHAKPADVSLLVSGVSLAMLALMLGTVRFLSKLWLIHQNLATAYAEKVAITQTYLALLNEKKLAENDRTIALATIFRSAVVDEREGLTTMTTAEALVRMAKGE